MLNVRLKYLIEEMRKPVVRNKTLHAITSFVQSCIQGRLIFSQLNCKFLYEKCLPTGYDETKGKEIFPKNQENNNTPQVKGLHVLYYAKYLEKQGMKIVKGQAYNDLFNLSDWDRIYEVMGDLYDSYLNWEIYKCRNITLRQGFDPESVIYVNNYGDTEYNNATHCFDHHFEPVLYSYTKNIADQYYDGLDEGQIGRAHV